MIALGLASCEDHSPHLKAFSITTPAKYTFCHRGLGLPAQGLG